MYYTPVNEFVARLFGEPEINIFPADISGENGVLSLKVLGQEQPLFPEKDSAQALREAGDSMVDVGIRGIDVDFSFVPDSSRIKGTVYAFEPIGNKVIMTADVNGEKIRIAAPNSTKADLDQPVYIKFNMKNALFFNREDKMFITRGEIEKYR
jgi:multiple sugar transport system ATP-binding protein